MLSGWKGFADEIEQPAQVRCGQVLGHQLDLSVWDCEVDVSNHGFLIQSETHLRMLRIVRMGRTNDAPPGL